MSLPPLHGKRSLDTPPHLVFNDATLAEMSAMLPTSPGEMLAVNGVGQIKLDRFGGEFLDEISDYLTG